MASISTDPTGYRRVIFTGYNGKRCQIRLGVIGETRALAVKMHIEELVTAKKTGSSPKGTTAEWVGGLNDRMHRILERAKLVEPRVRRGCPGVGDWVDGYIKSRPDVKPGTKVRFTQIKNKLVEFFGHSKRLDEITAGDAKDFQAHLKGSGLSEGTTRRFCGLAKQIFSAAVDKELIDKNPFKRLKCANFADEKKRIFISREASQAIIDACPTTEWRLIFALCRFGGLRCPSEVFGLKWESVDWKRMRLIVHSPKTEHCADGGIREVPIFPELYPFLIDRFDEAEPGDEHLITHYRDPKQNLRTQFGKIIARAGLTPWPKLFQNLRSTRETELVRDFPLHVVCKWIGNSQPVAMKHYLKVTDEDFQKAARIPAQQAKETDRNTPNQENENRDFESLRGDSKYCGDNELEKVGDTGFEPVTSWV